MSHSTPSPKVLFVLYALLAVPMAAAQPLTPTEIFKANKDAVVYLKVTGTDKNGVPTEREGTGFLVSSMGHLITAHHLLQDNKGRRFDQVKIEGASGSRHDFLREVEILEEAPSVDLILLRFRGGRTDYKTVRICSEEGLESGSPLVAIGFPRTSDLSIITGKLSNKAGPQGLYQTEVPFSRGYSGGPVFGEKGAVIGVVRGGPDVAGINFFAPISYARNLLNLVGTKPACNDANQSTPARNTKRSEKPDCNIQANQSAAACGDLNAGSINITVPGGR